MAAAITSITKPAPYSWRYAWSGTSPFYVIRNGVLVFYPSTARTDWVFEHDDNNEPPVIEVYDSTQAETASIQLTNPPYSILQWWHADYAAYYIVQKQVTEGATYWVTVPPIIIDRGVGYYQYATPILDDETTTTYRVIAYDQNGAQNAVEFDIAMVRNPTPPKVSFSYSAGTGNLTISERTS